MSKPFPPPVDYDRIAPDYDSRYRFRDLGGTGRALLRLAGRLRPARVLEAGCGTGHWLDKLHTAQPGAGIFGLDQSSGMLAQARSLPGKPSLLQGRAQDLPYAGAAFQLVYCINALHHFHHPQTFIAEARRVLASGGALFIANMDPHSAVDEWTVYDYFPGTFQTDLDRYPPSDVLRGWLRAAGFSRIRTRPVERIHREYAGDQVFTDPIIGRLGTSQLALLTDEEYEAGIERMRLAIKSGGQSPPLFRTHIILWGTVGYVPASTG